MASPAPRRDTAALHLVADVLTATPDETAVTARARLVAGTRYEQGTVYVVDDGRLLGVVPLPDLLLAGDEPLSRFMRPPVAVAAPDDDQERVAGLAVRHRLAAVPVVDAGGRLLGVVPAVALIAILHHEHVEDLHRLAGISREGGLARHAVEDPPARRARHRLPWLLVGLVGSMAAAAVVSRFEEVLSQDLRIAFVMPGIVYVADAIGTQTEAIAVRALSLTPRGLGASLLGEIGTGALIGVSLAGLATPAAWLAFGDLRLAVAIGLSVIIAGCGATTLGLLLPWAMHRLGIDPAFGSGPLATILQDVCTLLVFLGLSAALL